MKTVTRAKLWSLALVLTLVACAPTALAAPVLPTETLLPSVSPSPTATPTPAAGVTYTDAANEFELTYPAGWSLEPSKPIGSRASQARLLSPGTTAETLADGGARISIVVYTWDPKNDLNAYLARRKSAWDASGTKIIEETALKLAGERPAVGFIVQSTDNQQSFLLITTAGEKYLEIVGEGNLSLTREIALTLSPANK